MIGALIRRAPGIVLRGTGAQGQRTVSWPVGVVIAGFAELALRLPVHRDHPGTSWASAG